MDHPPNKHSESNYSIWHHTIHAPFPHIIILSSDTDTWVYGLGLVDITLATHFVASHPSISNITHPVSSLVTLYVLTGCDYVSSFD